MMKILKDTLIERLNDPSKRRGDFLDQAIDDLETKKFLTVDFIPQLIFGILFASYESISSTLTLAIKFLSENPQVVEKLTVSIINTDYQSFKLPDWMISGLYWR